MYIFLGLIWCNQKTIYTYKNMEADEAKTDKASIFYLEKAQSPITMAYFALQLLKKFLEYISIFSIMLKFLPHNYCICFSSIPSDLQKQTLQISSN